MEFFILMSVVALFLSSIIAAGLLAVIISALIMHYMPNTSAAKWLNGIWFDDEETPDEIYNSIGNVKAGRDLHRVRKIDLLCFWSFQWRFI